MSACVTAAAIAIVAAAAAPAAKGEYKLMLYVAINNGYAQQLRLPHRLNTLLLTQPPWSLKKSVVQPADRSAYVLSPCAVHTLHQGMVTDSCKAFLLHDIHDEQRVHSPLVTYKRWQL